MPYSLLASRSKLRFTIANHSQVSTHENFEYIEESRTVDLVCKRLRQLNKILAAEVLTQDLWRHDTFAVFHLTPVFHELFSIVRGSMHDSYQARQKECFRLAAILYMVGFREKFDPEPGSGMLYGTKLLTMLNTPGLTPSWGRSNHLLVWILTVASCSESLFHDLRQHFVARLSESIQVAAIKTSQEFVNLVRGIIWCDEAFGPLLRDLQSQIGIGQ